MYMKTVMLLIKNKKQKTKKQKNKKLFCIYWTILWKKKREKVTMIVNIPVWYYCSSFSCINCPLYFHMWPFRVFVCICVCVSACVRVCVVCSEYNMFDFFFRLYVYILFIILCYSNLNRLLEWFYVLNRLFKPVAMLNRLFKWLVLIQRYQNC